MADQSVISGLGTILSFWAHPDDETFSCAGIMAAAVRNGQRVVCVTATKGERGVQDESRWPATQLGEIRARELAAALSIIGVKEHHFLGYHDGECDKVPLQDGIAHVVRYINEIRPNSILTFGKDGMTGHTDHIAVSRWVQEATRTMPNAPTVYYCATLRSVYNDYLAEADRQFNIFFNIDKPRLVNRDDCHLCFECDDELCRIKCAALRAMPSQTEAMFAATTAEQQRSMLVTEAFTLAP